jgi:DNA-directed RNA polymerase subunit beta
MPHLPYGTPVEIVFSFLGTHTRLNFGQIREAVMSHLARAEGKPIEIPPFKAPGDEELKGRLREAGLPESGMVHLTLGRDGERLPCPSTVGYIYWGKFRYLTARRTHPMHFSTTPDGRCLRQGELEYYVLRNAGAYELIRETFNTRSAEGERADKVSQDVAAGALTQAGPPTPAFAELCQSLSVGGIRAELEGEQLRLRLAEPSGETLSLARPVPNWGFSTSARSKRWKPPMRRSVTWRTAGPRGLSGRRPSLI